MQLTRIQRQKGSFVLEAIIAILIFSMGLIGLIALQGTATATSTDTRYRIEANQFANRIISSIQANAVRTGETQFRASIDAFGHNQTGDQCTFSGTASAHPIVTTWLNDLSAASSAGRLPDADAQIRVTWGTGTANQVRIIICWQQPGLPVKRRHIVTGSIS